MGIVLGPCKKCGKMLTRPHPSGLCHECRKKYSILSPKRPDIPDIPDPIEFKE